MATHKRWFDGVSMLRLIQGTLCGWIVCVVLVVDLSSRGFAAIDRTTVSGEVIDAGATMVGDRPAYDVLLGGYSVRFRVSTSIVEDVWGGRFPASLTPGTTATLIVPRDQLESPVTALLDPVPTVSIDALILDGRTVLGLDQSKLWQEKNRRVGAWLVPVFSVVTLLCTTALICRVRRWRVNAAAATSE